MRINNNVRAMNTHRQYTINTASVGKPTEKFSGSHRPNRAGSDAAGLAVSENVRVQIQGLKAASKDTSDAISLTQAAGGALEKVEGALERMRELSATAASGEPGTDYAALDAEFQQHIAEIDSIVSGTRFNKRGVIDGSYSQEATPASLKAAAVSALGDYAKVAWEANPIVVRTGPNPGEEMRLSIADMHADILGVGVLSLADEQAAQQAHSRVGDALRVVAAEQSSLSELQGKLRYAISNLDTSAENLSAAGSRIRDFDIAAEAANYTRNNILQQGGAAALAQASNVPQDRVLSLLD